jgi:hypothetical protein
MRIIREFPFTDSIKASLFSWNGKYILKLECGLMEQTYKIPESETGGESDLMNFCSNKIFKETVIENFQRMESCWPPEE